VCVSSRPPLRATRHERVYLHAHFVNLGGKTQLPNVANERTVITWFNSKVMINTMDEFYTLGFEDLEVTGTKA